MAVSGQEGLDDHSYSQQQCQSHIGRDGGVSYTPRGKCLTTSGSQPVRCPFFRAVGRCLFGCLLRKQQQVNADTERIQEQTVAHSNRG